MRVVAYMLHWRSTSRPESVSINIRKYLVAFYRVIRMSQYSDFSEEILRVKNDLPIKKRSKLKSLDPFLDSNDVLRVGGRLEKVASLSLDRRNPIINSGKSRFAKLLSVFTPEIFSRPKSITSHVVGW